MYKIAGVPGGVKGICPLGRVRVFKITNLQTSEAMRKTQSETPIFGKFVKICSRVKIYLLLEIGYVNLKVLSVFLRSFELIILIVQKIQKMQLSARMGKRGRKTGKFLKF